MNFVKFLRTAFLQNTSGRLLLKKKSSFKKSQILSNISNNIYNKLHHFDNDIIVQTDNGNTKTEQIQRTRNVSKSKSIQTKSEEISTSSKLFHGAPFAYFPGTCVSRKLYSNLISKSRSHLKFTVTLSFYVFTSFPLRISSVNVTKSAAVENWGFGHIY